MSGSDLRALAGELCRVFLGWRLREDEPALLALGEGSLSIDLLRGEARCDGDPLPPLFIAGELQRQLFAALEAAGDAAPQLREARLDAEFAARPPGVAGARQATLQISCVCVLRDAKGEHRQTARRDPAAE